MGNGESDPLFTILGGHSPYQILLGCTRTHVLDQKTMIWYGIGIKSIINDGATPRRALGVRIFNCDSDAIGDYHKNLL